MSVLVIAFEEQSLKAGEATSSVVPHWTTITSPGPKVSVSEGQIHVMGSSLRVDWIRSSPRRWSKMKSFVRIMLDWQKSWREGARYGPANRRILGVQGEIESVVEWIKG
jgi:hypothetical protein